MDITLANIGLIIAYILIATGAVAAIAFTIIDIVRSPGGAVKSAIGVGGFLVIIFISYLITSGDSAKNYDDVSELRAHLTSTALYVLYITGFFAIAGLLISTFSEAIR